MVDNHRIVIERMSRQIETNHFALFVEHLQLIPILGNRHSWRLNINNRATTKQTLLRVEFLLLNTLTITHQLLKEG